MSNDITANDIRHATDGDSKPFLSLLDNESELKVVAIALETVVLRSFGEDERREPFRETRVTRSEIRRRYTICIAWFRHARAELGMSCERAVDLMPQALRCELDGITFEPRTSGIWTPP